MKIFKTVNRVPGGLMVVPLFLGMVLNTFFPDLVEDWRLYSGIDRSWLPDRYWGCTSSPWGQK